MRNLFNKKWIAAIVATLGVSTFCMSTAKADAADTPYLTSILAVLGGALGSSPATTILSSVSGIPQYISDMTKRFTNLLDVEGSTTISDQPTNLLIPNMSTSFASLGQYMLQDFPAPGQALTGNQLQLIADMYGIPISNFSLPGTSPNSPIVAFPNINNNSYSTMLGQPPVSTSPTPAYNYVKNASGIMLFHILPNQAWQGDHDSIATYNAEYNTIMAIESFNGYVLNQQIADQASGLTTAQSSLVNQASASNYLALVAGEDVGRVLREILIFNSQTYVLLTQLVQIQRQQLIAQTMTNSLLIINNQPNEVVISSKANRG